MHVYVNGREVQTFVITITIYKSLRLYDPAYNDITGIDMHLSSISYIEGQASSIRYCNVTFRANPDIAVKT